MRSFADTGRAVHEMCCAGERGDDLGYFDSAGLLRFSRSYIAVMMVHRWSEDVPVEPPMVSHTLYGYHESFCHLTLPG